MPAEQKLKDKVAIITGASRGMGRASALLFAEHGAKVVINYKENKSAAEQVVNKIRQLGSDAFAIQGDVGDLNDIPRLVDGCLEKFGKLDILYHNAAVRYVCHELQDVTPEIWDLTFNSIVKGPFFLTRYAIPHLKKSGEGCIIFTTTASSQTAAPMDPHYMTAKAAVDHLVRILAGWVCPEIRVNCIMPGPVMTDMFRTHSPEMWNVIASTVPMNRMITSTEIAQAALFLASPEAKMITGIGLPVDGGKSSAVPRRAVAPFVEKMKPGTDTFDKSSYSEERICEMDVGLKP